MSTKRTLAERTLIEAVRWVNQKEGILFEQSDTALLLKGKMLTPEAQQELRKEWLAMVEEQLT